MVWKELNYGSMREKEKQLVVSEVRIKNANIKKRVVYVSCH